MPQPRVFEVMRAFRLALLRRERKSATRLVNAYGEAYQRLLPQIEALQAELEVVGVKEWKRYKLKRLESLKKQIEYEINEYAVFADREMILGAKEAINQAGKESKIITHAALPGFEPVDARIMQSWNRLPTESVETLLGFLANGSPLRESLRSFGSATADLVEQRLTEGIALGYSPRKIASIMRDELGQSLIWSLRTARTAQIYSYREAARANYLANDHVVKGWIWRCARSDNTCMSCIAMDGTKHPLTERLNDHHNGRCSPEPETLTYRELGIGIDEPPPLVVEDAKSWFGKQSEEVQRKMLKGAKYDAWKAGEFDLDKLTGTSTDSIWGDIRVETPLKDLVTE